MQADAADESAISGVCTQALREEGRLDVFFANVCPALPVLHPPTLNLVCKAGVASKQALADTSSENFMNSMRINALSYVKEPRCHPLIEHLASRCFLAVKFASAAMQKTNPSRGKDYTGGSIIMTASGTYPSRILLTNIHIHIPIPPSRRHSLWCRNSGL